MTIYVLVKPNSSESKIKELTSNQLAGYFNISNERLKTSIGLKVYVRANPEKGEANTELIDLIKDYYGVAKNQIIIKSGNTSSLKVIEIID